MNIYNLAVTDIIQGQPVDSIDMHDEQTLNTFRHYIFKALDACSARKNQELININRLYKELKRIDDLIGYELK